MKLNQLIKHTPKSLGRFLPFFANFAYIFIQKEIREMVDYEKYWDEENGITTDPIYRSFTSQKYSILEKTIEDKSSVLDIGCGNGDFLFYLMEHKNIKAFGVDISQTAISQANEKGIIGEVADITNSSFSLKRSYDYITILDVLEHIQDPEIIMEKIKNRFVKKLIISVPNVGYFRHRLRLLFGSFVITWGVHPREHIRFWTLKDFKWWCEKANRIRFSYRINKIYPCYGIPILKSIFPSLFSAVLIYVLDSGFE